MFEPSLKALEDKPPDSQKDGCLLFPAQRFLIDLCTTTPIAFSHNKGSLLHGGFGAALKSLVCVVKNTPCPLRNLQYFHWEPRACAGDEALLDLSRHVQVEQEEMEWVGQGRLLHGKWMPQGGLVGEITFRGDKVAFIPFLELGELVHVGKGVTFGMGRYQAL